MAIQNLKISEYRKLSKPAKKQVRREFKLILKKRRARARTSPTPAEKQAQKLLIKEKIQFEKQKIFRQFRVDLYLRASRTIIEIDGGYHNENKTKDMWRSDQLLSHGKINHILRFTNDDVFNKPEYFIGTIREHITSL